MLKKKTPYICAAFVITLATSACGGSDEDKTGADSALLRDLKATTPICAQGSFELCAQTPSCMDALECMSKCSDDDCKSGCMKAAPKVAQVAITGVLFSSLEDCDVVMGETCVPCLQRKCGTDSACKQIAQCRQACAGDADCHRACNAGANGFVSQRADAALGACGDCEGDEAVDPWRGAASCEQGCMNKSCGAVAACHTQYACRAACTDAACTAACGASPALEAALTCVPTKCEQKEGETCDACMQRKCADDEACGELTRCRAACKPLDHACQAACTKGKAWDLAEKVDAAFGACGGVCKP